MAYWDAASSRARLVYLEQALVEKAKDLAVFLVYDRPERVEERPALARAFFAQRCVSEEQLDRMTQSLRSVGAYVELFHGERAFIDALASGRLTSLPQRLKVAYNGVEGGITTDGFKPGRKALIPAVADAYDILCANSNAHACAVGRHKFHYFTLLRALGVPTPQAWHYRLNHGWAQNVAPPRGVRVIAKSTYESWSVGVTENSVFTVDASCDARVHAVAESIGQSVTVQEFIPGAEVCVPVYATPVCLTTPPVQAVLAKAPGDPDAVMTINDNLTPGAVSHRALSAGPHVVETLNNAALAAFDLLELGAFARMDFRIDLEGRACLTDVGVSPGVGLKSSAYRSLAHWGFDYASFLRVVFAAALADSGHLA